MSLSEGILSLFVVCIIIYINEHKHEYMTTEKISHIDQRSYKVVGSFANSGEAADKMAELHKFIINYLKFIKTKFITHNQGTAVQQKFVSRVLNNYNPDVIFENNPGIGDDTSYVTNKGERFAICLREKVGSDHKKIHSQNILKFVILHELSHLGTITYGHNKEFWDSFKFMLIQATESGLYVPVDYENNKTNYCGLDVQFNPYYSVEYQSI